MQGNASQNQRFVLERNRRHGTKIYMHTYCRYIDRKRERPNENHYGESTNFRLKFYIVVREKNNQYVRFYKKNRDVIFYSSNNYWFLLRAYILRRYRRTFVYISTQIHILLDGDVKMIEMSWSTKGVLSILCCICIYSAQQPQLTLQNMKAMCIYCVKLL